MIFSTPQTNSRKSDRIAASTQSLVISVHPLPGNGARGILRFGAVTMQCALGRSGIVSLKREGDSGTPRAVMGLVGGYYRRGRSLVLRTRLPMAAIREELGWCDDPASANYNRPVRLPFAASHENMLRGDGLYDFCLVLDWNLNRRRKNAGSAIFMHIARKNYEPTEGCIAVAPRDMARLLPYLSKSVRLVVGRAIKRPSSQ
jgi:L,D-peptidoglycan transpeptidase YkuD (ErfK/YbiS/YcfS/YnhG family)